MVALSLCARVGVDVDVEIDIDALSFELVRVCVRVRFEGRRDADVDKDADVDVDVVIDMRSGVRPERAFPTRGPASAEHEPFGELLVDLRARGVRP